MAGMREEEALRVIFDGDPPDGNGPRIPSSLGLDLDLHVPCFWRSALDAAMDAGILDAAAARK